VLNRYGKFEFKTVAEKGNEKGMKPALEAKLYLVWGGRDVGRL
jgi:hypothetical protein